MKDKLARIAWRSEATGATGHGDWLPRTEVRTALDYLRRQRENYGVLQHWIEEKPAHEPAQDGEGM